MSCKLAVVAEIGADAAVWTLLSEADGIFARRWKVKRDAA